MQSIGRIQKLRKHEDLPPCKNHMTKRHNKPRKYNRSRIAQENEPRSNQYYNALIKTGHYDPQLGSKEAHESRHKARLQVLHSENRTIAQEAAKDLRLHGRSLVTRRVTPLQTTKSIPSLQKVHQYPTETKEINSLSLFYLTCCNCLLIDLICLEKCKE